MRLLAAALLGLILALPSYADPGNIPVTNDPVVGSTDLCNQIKDSTVCYVAFNSSTASDTVVFPVTADKADIFIVVDPTATGDTTATATIWRIAPGGTTDEEGFIPTADSTGGVLTSSSGDCFPAVKGDYWIDLGVPSGAAVPRVVIVGRD